MFDFFQNIFGKVISLMASAIIAVGLISVPEIPDQSLQIEQPKGGVVIEKVETKEVKQNEVAKKQIIDKTKNEESLHAKSIEKQNDFYNEVNEERRKKAEEIEKRHEEIEKELKLALEGGQESILQHQPRLILFKDDLGNVYTETKDFVRNAGESFNNGFGASYTPRCLQMSDTTYDCQSEIIKWVNDRSVEIRENINITLGGFDADSDDVFYFISYGSRKDFSFGNMRVLQSWEKNNVFSIPITEQLYNETLFENLGWSSTYFDSETRRYYEKNVRLNNAGELNIQVCFNDKLQKMEYPYGEQFPDGCMLFKYFILKPGYSDMKTSTSE